MRSLCIAVAFNCFAFGPAAAVTVIGHGTQTCGAWTAAAKEESVTRLVQRVWVAGYVSGVAITTGRDIIGPTDYDGMMAWIDQFCTANPLSTIQVAADALAYRLDRNLAN